MKRLILALPLLLLARPASAVEFGILRALQHGPIGDAPEYADIGHYEAEAGIDVSRTYGSYAVNDDETEKIDAARLHTGVMAGGGWEPTKNFELTTQLDATLVDTYTEQRAAGPTRPKLDSGAYKNDFDVFGLYRAHPVVFGGGIGLVVFTGGHTRQFDQDSISIKENVGSAFMPTLNLFGGIITKEVDATLGFRLFSQGTSTVTFKDSAGNDQQFDVARRVPAEIHADGRIKFKEAQIAAALSYLLTGQASEEIDEYSTRYTTSGTHKVRNTGGYSRDSNQFRAAVGGKFEPTKMIMLLGGLTYFGPYYAKEEFASIEDENLGGFRIDLGTDIRIQKFRGFFQAGYQIDSTASFTQADDSRSTPNDDETLRPPVAKGDSVKATQGKWEITAGGGIVL